MCLIYRSMCFDPSQYFLAIVIAIFNLNEFDIVKFNRSHFKNSYFQLFLKKSK